MVMHLFPNFLHDDGQYRGAESYWQELWGQIDPASRSRFGWQHPWFEPLPPSLCEGNPIFSAVSPTLRRGIRVIQDAPSERGLEFVAYPDTFGGDITDPDSINELVISCALSDLASALARDLMTPWVRGESISFGEAAFGILLPGGYRRPNTPPLRMGWDLDSDQAA